MFHRIRGGLFAVALSAAWLVDAEAAAPGREKTNMLKNGDFRRWTDSRPDGWTLGAPREEIAPRLTREPGEGGRGWAALHAAESGLTIGWISQHVDTSALCGKWLRFSCLVRVSGDQDPGFTARAALEWSRKPGLKGWMPTWEFAYAGRRVGDGAYLIEHAAQVPAWADGLTVRLLQYGGKEGRVAFSQARLEPAPAPKTRRVRIAAAFRPPAPGGWSRTLADVERLTNEAAGRGCDLILFGEGLTVVGTGKSYVDAAQPAPGPAVEALGAIARRHRIFLAAGVYERDGRAAYNTAVLIDRQGRLVGKYRKVHLPYPELKAGLQPGDDYPVFDTEIGRIGLQVCYDHFFPETARCLALRGAEIILTPIWGDVRGDGSLYEIVARARAIDNAVFYVTSIYAPLGSLIVDPYGRVLARTPKGEKKPSLAIADIDLDLPRRPDLPFPKRQAFPMNFRAERRPQSYAPIVQGTR